MSKTESKSGPLILKHHAALPAASQHTAGRFAYTPKQFSVFTGKRCHFHSSRGVIFTRSYLLRPANIHVKNYSAIARRKNIPFYPARTGINFSYFQLARRSFRFPSQLICQGFFFPASSNSAWRAGILSSGSVGYSWNLDSQTKMLGDHPSQWIYHSRIMTVFHEFSRFTLCHTGQFTDPANPPPPLSVLIGESFDFRFCYFKKQFNASLEQFYIFPGRSVCMWTLDYTFELNSLFQKSSELRPKN